MQGPAANSLTDLIWPSNPSRPLIHHDFLRFLAVHLSQAHLSLAQPTPLLPGVLFAISSHCELVAAAASLSNTQHGHAVLWETNWLHQF